MSDSLPEDRTGWTADDGNYFPYRALYRFGAGYQWGLEFGGYGGPEGHCRKHAPHRTEARAEKCGRRFALGKPPLLWDRMPWRLDKKGRWS